MRCFPGFFALQELPHIRALFVVGIPSGNDADNIQTKIEAESQLYGDILQVDYIENYNNNTLKSLHALKFVLNVNWGEQHPEFIMKCDDDVYINLPQLSQRLFDSGKYK